MNAGSKYALPVGYIVTKYGNAIIQSKTPKKDRAVISY
jgi:hypothetical protein